LFAPLLALALVVFAIPRASDAQQPGKIPRIGILSGASSSSTPMFEAFREGLRDHGYVEGQNIVLEFRLARGNLDLFPTLAADLVRLNVDVIVTDGGNAAPLAARNATRTIPIVMAVSGQPDKAGLIASFARPGGNVTGLTLLAQELAAKRLQLFKEAFPRATRLSVLMTVANSRTSDYMRLMEEASPTLGLKLQPVPIEVRSASDLDSAFQSLVRQHADGFVTIPDVMLWNNRMRIADFARKNRLPAMFPEREFADAGGLMAYGPNVQANFRRAAAFVDKILKGARPADLPVEEPTKIELVINLKTAKALGLTIPSALLQRADQVIE
jgi:putative ABC transport system substrate-binding protein